MCYSSVPVVEKLVLVLSRVRRSARVLHTSLPAGNRQIDTSGDLYIMSDDGASSDEEVQRELSLKHSMWVVFTMIF